MQGWTPDFIPKLTADAVDTHVINRVIPIANVDALRCSRDLAQKEGIFVGITAGATFAGGLHVCADAPKGATYSACCLILASAISVHRCLRIFLPI
jgi:cysteine synthase A